MKHTAYRGTSAILLFNNDHGLLMDAGEGSYGQICDHFKTKDAIAEVLLSTQFVFITHIHGDH